MIRSHPEKNYIGGSGRVVGLFRASFVPVAGNLCLGLGLIDYMLQRLHTP